MDTPFNAQWRGFHHVALLTPDLDATIAFYRDLLGMQAGEIMGGDGRRPRHCFVKPGASETWGMHFFENPDAELFTNTELLKGFDIVKGALQHIAFALPDEAAAHSLRERLKQHNVEMTGINDLGKIHNFLFLDNNNILLEAAWSKP
jgi:catechol 2,3-dioxygenase-like lactoylglutathione lyase family enzyme